MAGQATLLAVVSVAALAGWGGCSSFPENAFSGKQWEEVLMERLLDGYNELVLPVRNASQPVVVGFALSLVQLLQIDEQSQVRACVASQNVLLFITWLYFMPFIVHNLKLVRGL